MRSTWLAGLTGVFLFLGLLLPASTPAAADKVLLGYAETLSGQHSKAGAQSSWGVKASVKWINEVQGGIKIGGKKVPLEIKLYDNESKRESATSLIERLVSVDKADAIIAPYSAGLTMAGAPIAEKYRKVYLSHGGSSNRIFEQGFRYAVLLVTPASDFQVGALEMFHKLDPKAKRVALVFEDDEFARMAYQGAEEHAKKLGYEIVFKRTYPNNVTDLTPLLSDLKASKPDLILGGGHFADGLHAAVVRPRYQCEGFLPDRRRLAACVLRGAGRQGGGGRWTLPVGVRSKVQPGGGEESRPGVVWAHQ
jgi:branched-chain amino acid transport system substrate-binding protein